MNTLIITLGNSEIQFDESNLGSFKLSENNLVKGNISIQVKSNNRIGLEKYLIPKYSRQAGKIIAKRYEEFREVIKFPIIEPLIDFIPEKNIGKVIFVVTDQDSEKYSKGDTLYYPLIIQSYFSQKNLRSILYSVERVHDYVKDADKQYKLWGEKFSNLNSDESSQNHFYLFAQGGIDQINHAITLQLLQKVKQNVSIYQKAENEKLKKVEFAQLFLADLTKLKVIKHLEDFDFGKAGELFLNNPKLRKICQDAQNRLSLNHESISNETFRDNWHKNSEIAKNRQKIKDLIYAYRIDFKQQNYNDGLTKLYTIYENIFKQIIDEYTNQKTSDYYDKKNRSPKDKNKEWERFLKSKFGENVINRLKKRKRGIHLNNPNSMTYFYLLRFLIEDGKENRFTDENTKKLDGLLNKMRWIRNQINHSLGHATIEVIEKELGNKNNIEGLDSLLDKFAYTNGLKEIREVRDDLLEQINYHEKI